MPVTSYHACQHNVSVIDTNYMTCITKLKQWMKCTSQLKPPAFGSQGRVVDLTLTLVKRRQYPYPLRLEFSSNTPTPETSKLKISKVHRKKKTFAVCWKPDTLKMEPLYGTVSVKPLFQTTRTFLMPSAILEEAPYEELVPRLSLDHGPMWGWNPKSTLAKCNTSKGQFVFQKWLLSLILPRDPKGGGFNWLLQISNAKSISCYLLKSTMYYCSLNFNVVLH